MKAFVSVALASMIAFGAVTSASAFSFSPPNTRFKLNGTVFVAKHGRQVQCIANMVGVTGASGTSTARITRAAFGGTGTCFVSAMGLPWTLKATGAGTATLSGLAFTDGGAPCGPSTAPVTVDAQGVWSIRAIDVSGGCSFLANTLATTPPITIVQ